MISKIPWLLKDYGLDDNEIRVYLFLIEESELTAYNIAKRIKVHKSTCYDVLDRLISKGFASKIEKQGKAFYSAIELGQTIIKIKEKETILRSLIPEVEKVRARGISKVRVLENKESQNQFNLSLLEKFKNGEIESLYLLSPGPQGFVDFSDGTQIFLESFLREVRKSRFSKDREYKGIWNEGFKGSKLVKWFKGIGEDRFMKDLPTKATTVIYGEYVAFMFRINEEPQVIEIQNHLIAEEMRAYFRQLWKIAQK